VEERLAEPVWLPEGRWSTTGWHGEIPVPDLLGEATVAELRARFGMRQNPGQRRRPRRNPSYSHFAEAEQPLPPSYRRKYIKRHGKRWW